MHPFVSALVLSTRDVYLNGPLPGLRKYVELSLLLDYMLKVMLEGLWITSEKIAT